MLARKHFDQTYIDACRGRIAAQLANYRAVKASADDAAIAAFEPPYFDDLVLVLDNLFVHRMRGMEGKPGSPLKEFRALCESITEDGHADVPLDEESFHRLAEQFFAEIENRYQRPE